MHQFIVTLTQTLDIQTLDIQIQNMGSKPSSVGETKPPSVGETKPPSVGETKPSSVEETKPSSVGETKSKAKNYVCPHARHFATADDRLTTASMTEGHEGMGITSGVSLKVRVINNLLDDYKRPHTVTGIASINNPASTGIWRPDGTLDEYRLDDLCSFAINDNGKRILLRSYIDIFLGKYHGHADSVATHVYMLPVNWGKHITCGSFNDLFDYWSDHTYLKSGKPEKAITVERLRLFYTNPEEFMKIPINKK